YLFFFFSSRRRHTRLQVLEFRRVLFRSIPIVMMGPGSDPVESGHVESLARPGGNVTGLTNLNRDLGGKRLELLKEAVPKLVRVEIGRASCRETVWEWRGG